MRREWIRRRTEGRARVRWWHAERRRIDAEQARVGLPALIEEQHQICERESKIEEVIVALPAEWDSSDAERRAHRGRGGEAVRRAEAQQLVRQLGELLYFLRFCAKPARVRPDDWLAYRPVAQRLVATGQWKAEALKMFD
jgi:hypothetical protein